MLDLALQSGKIIALKGEKATVSTLLISMAVRLQEHSKVLYIDSAHTFSPGFVERNYHKNPHLALSRISIARPWSPEQVLALVKKLDQAIRETRAKSVIISSLDGPFLDQPGDSKDVAFLFSELMEHLRLVARRHGTVILVGLSSRVHEIDGGSLDRLVKDSLDMVCQV